jgi:dTDP-4-dehydrorhamnose reductase
MKVLITGANGMVARAAAEHCRAIGDDVVALTRQEMNIADRNRVFETLRSKMPDAVINCAAYTDVDGAESDPDAARDANTLGPKHLAEACKETGARLVTISTDYVFDGSKTDFYTEDDTPAPRGVYGVTKYEGELAVASANPQSVIVRSGWIYGPGGTNFLSVMHKLLADGKRIKAISDAYGTPTYANDLAKRLRELAELAASGIFHVTNSGDGTTYLGFAEKVCDIGGFDKRQIDAVSNDDLKRPAPRPKSSKLATIYHDLPMLQNWEDALRQFITDEKEKADSST